ncbi:MAG: hypothetical protein ACI8ZB_003718 [Desulforhopalus sp.]|jgi:hypothetical protein
MEWVIVRGDGVLGNPTILRKSTLLLKMTLAL